MLGVVVYLPEDLPGCAEDATFWIEEIYEEICNRTHVYRVALVLNTLCATPATPRAESTARPTTLKLLTADNAPCYQDSSDNRMLLSDESR